MIQKNFIIFVLLISFAASASAQNDAKIEKKLQKLFAKGKYQKCQQRAIRFNKKYPHSFIPELYLSKVKLQNYANKELSAGRRYLRLKAAANYSNKLSAAFHDWKGIVQDSLKAYVNSEHDSTQFLVNCKRAVKFYVETYHDTLSIYTYYFPSNEKAENLVPSSFKTKSDSLRWELIKFAEKQDGIKYTYAGEKPETGFDCSGFTKYVYEHIGIELPHNAHKQSKLDGTDKILAEAKAGDLIFFGSKSKNRYYTQHTGIIYSVDNGNIKVIHCVSGGVSIDGEKSGWDLYWRDKVLFVKTLGSLDIP